MEANLPGRLIEALEDEYKARATYRKTIEIPESGIALLIKVSGAGAVGSREWSKPGSPGGGLPGGLGILRSVMVSAGVACHNAASSGISGETMPSLLQTEVQLGRQGRLVIPAELRRALAVEAGDPLIARVENGRLILEKRENIRERLKARFAGVSAELSLADELIADRRREDAE